MILPALLRRFCCKHVASRLHYPLGGHAALAEPRAQTESGFTQHKVWASGTFCTHLRSNRIAGGANNNTNTLGAQQMEKHQAAFMVATCNLDIRPQFHHLPRRSRVCVCVCAHSSGEPNSVGLSRITICLRDQTQNSITQARAIKNAVKLFRHQICSRRVYFES